LGHLDSVVDLKLCDIDTRDLLKLSGSPPNLKSITILNPEFDLARDQFELAAAKICRPGVKVTLRYGVRGEAHDDVDDYEDAQTEAERNFWQSLPDVTCETYTFEPYFF
jgi:hypothetical protein